MFNWEQFSAAAQAEDEKPRRIFVYTEGESSDPHYVLVFNEPRSRKDARDILDGIDLNVELTVHPERFTDENVDDHENGPQGTDFGDEDRMCEIINASERFKNAGCTITYAPLMW